MGANGVEEQARGGVPLGEMGELLDGDGRHADPLVGHVVGGPCSRTLASPHGHTGWLSLGAVRRRVVASDLAAVDTRSSLHPEERTVVNAVIVDAIRTPLGRRNGRLKDWHPVDLAAETLRAVIERTGIKAD